MNIAKIMTPKVNTAFICEQDTVRQGLEIMREHGYTAVPVLNSDGKYIGCVTEGDFLRYVLDRGTTELKEYERDRIGEIIRRDFCPAIEITEEEKDVILSVLNQNFVPVVDARGCLCGIVTRRKVIEYLAAEKDGIREETV